MKTVFVRDCMKVSGSVLLLTTALANTAMADPYIGVGVGSAQYKVDLSDLDGGSNFEDSGTGTKIYGGYGFNKYFAVEATYYNFAEASIGAFETGPGSGDFYSASAKMSGFGAYAVGMYPVSKSVNLMAKLGMLNWDADLSVNDAKGSNGGTDLAYGVAASYAFTKEFLGVAEWEFFDSDNPELSMFSVGVRLVFD